jgi:hypothetical protein
MDYFEIYQYIYNSFLHVFCLICVNVDVLFGQEFNYIISFFQDDIKEEVGPERSSICNGDFNQISECNKCNLQQYSSESLCRNEM